MNRTIALMLACAPCVALAGAPAETTPNAPKGLSHVIQLETYKNPDWGARLAACMKDLPPEGGICDGRTDAGSQILNGAVTISRNNVQILLNAGAIRLAQNASIELTGSGISIIGIGKQATTFSLGPGARFRIGNTNAIARKWILQGFGIVNAGGNKTAAGLTLENAREGRIQDVLVYGFSDSIGIAVSQNCWTVILDDLNVSTNRVGLSFRGTQTNAWVIRSSLFVSNSIGALFDLGSGSAQGILFTDGTHFEGNTNTGILFQSGDIHEVAVTNAYVEIYAGQQFVKVEATGPAIRLRAFDYSGGHIYTKDQSPFYFAVRPSDFVRATIRGLYYTSSAAGTPAAVFSGATASGVIIGALASDSHRPDAEVTVKNINGGRGVVFDVTKSGTHP
jgi:hypothetical protein